MQVSGLTFIRNAAKFDYPVVEAITSILPVCDVFYVGVGNSEDGTRQLIEFYLGCRPGGQVIVCSGYVQEELLRRDLDAGAHAYLPKPFQMSELVERIGSLIEREHPSPGSLRGQA